MMKKMWLAMTASAAAGLIGGLAINVPMTAVQAAQAAAPAFPDQFVLPRMYGGADGESHIEPFNMPRTLYEPSKRVQSRLWATDVEMEDTAPGSSADWHGVSTPRLLVVLKGKMIVTLGDGSEHLLQKGDMVLAADTTGRGHKGRTIGTEPVRVMTVRLPKDNALAPKMDPCPPGVPNCIASRFERNPEGTLQLKK